MTHQKGSASGLRWTLVSEDTFELSGRSRRFRLSSDKQTLIGLDAFLGQTWRRTTPLVVANPQAAAAAQTLRAEFEKLNKTCVALMAESMRSYNRQDTSNLEALKKRVGTSDIELLQKIQEALTSVANNESFEVNGVADEKKRTANERALVSIKNTRERNIASAQKSVSSRSKSAYDALVKRAIAANDLELAKEIQTQVLAFSLSPGGNWRECFMGRARIVIEANGVVRHGEGTNGKWRQTSPGVFTITREGSGGHLWAGSVWKISADGKTLTRTDPNPVWRGWVLVRE
jgi:hypothetical protein